MQTYLTGLAIRLEANRAEAQKIQREMVTAVKAAKVDGYSMSDIAVYLGISRQTAYTYLDS